MAAALVVPTASRTNIPLAITGTGFQVSSPVTVSIPQENLVLRIETDIAGDFDLSSIWEWKPSKVGRLSVSADDGTDVETTDIVIYATT